MRFQILLFLTSFCLINQASFAQYLRDWAITQQSPSGTNGGPYADVDSAGYVYVIQSENALQDYFTLTKYDQFGLMVWQRFISNSGTTAYNVRGITLGENNNIYAIASAYISGVRYIMLYKYDTTGNQIWNTVYDDSPSLPARIKYDPNGYIYITGANDVFNPPNQCLTLKYDLDGNLLWSDLLQNPQNNVGNDFAFDSQGNIFVCHGYGIVKYSPQGDTLWTTTTNLYAFVNNNIVLDSQGNVIVCGTNVYPNPRNIELRKFDSNGSLLWSKTYNGSLNQDDSPSELIVDDNNNIYVAGTCNGFLAATGVGDLLLQKYDPDGNLLETEIMIGTSDPLAGSDAATDIKLGPDGYLYASGYLFNDSTKSDAFICKMDLSFNILWQDIYNHPGNENEGFTELHFDGNGNLYGCGLSSQGQWTNWASALIAKYCGTNCLSLNRPNIRGKVFSDNNQNCTQEQGENYLEGRMVELTGGPTIAYALTDTGGNFSFYAQPGNYMINTNTMNWWVNTCAPGVSAAIANPGDSSVNNLVGSYLPPNIQDLFISLGGGLVRPGHYTDYLIHYANQGTTTTDGRVVFTYDSMMTYESATPTPDSLLTNRLVWNFTGLAPTVSGAINLTMRMDSTVTLGLEVTPLQAIVEPLVTDVVPFDNIDSLYQTVIGPFDPNHKSVVPQGILEENVDTVLTYMVQFQNMGTDTAFTVVVRDTISDWLDLSTFKLGATSSPATVQFVGNLMFVRFEGANLPPDTVNYLGSQGFFKYSIHLKENVPLGTDIQNRAHIYFDYAAPVATEATHSYVGYKPDGVKEIGKDESGFNIYPNPFTGRFTLEADISKASNVGIEIFDINGRIVYSSQTMMQAGRNKVNIEFDKSGIYLVRTIIDGKVGFKKIISLKP